MKSKSLFALLLVIAGSGIASERPLENLTMDVRYLVMKTDLADEIMGADRKNATSWALHQKTLERIRALEREKKIFVVGNSKLTMAEGECSKILTSREMIYPSSFTDPCFEEIRDGTNVTARITKPTITMPTASAFSTREVGTILDVKPILSKDRSVITVTLSPEIVDLVGKTRACLQISGREPFFLEQPVFSKRTLTTSIVLGNGNTVILGRMPPPEAYKPAEKGASYTMLLTLSASGMDAEHAEPPLARPPSIFVETQLIAMSRANASDILNQEIGSLKDVNLTPDKSEKIRAAIRAGHIQEIDHLGICTCSGESARLLATREMIYPSAYTDPQVCRGTETDPERTDKTTTIGPSPAAFSTREVGMILDVKPTVNSESTISTTLSVEHVEELTQESADDFMSVDRHPVFSKQQIVTSLVSQSGETKIMAGGDAPEFVRKAHPREDWLMFVLFRATAYAP